MDVLETYHQRLRRLEQTILSAGNGNCELAIEDLHFLLGKAKVAELLEEENRFLRYKMEDDYVTEMKNYLRFLEKENKMLTNENKRLRKK